MSWSSPNVEACSRCGLTAGRAAYGGLVIAASELAWPYVQAIPTTAVRLRLACAWPLLLALATLTKVRQAGSPILHADAPVKVTRGQVYGLIARSTGAALLDQGGQGRRLDRIYAAALAARHPQASQGEMERQQVSK